VSLVVAFHRAGASYGSDTKPYQLLRVYFWLSLIGSISYVAFVMMRRNLPAWLSQLPPVKLMARHMPALPTIDAESFATRSIADLPGTTWWWLGVPAIIAVILFVLFAWAPVVVAPQFGALTILLLALSGWIALGSAADLYGMRYHVPVFLSLLILALAFSLINDNHAVRSLEPNDLPQVANWESRRNVEDELREWMKKQLSRPTAGPKDKLPLFLVAAEGGGIRAAYWTVSVLTHIQDTNPCFADQLFALSGVSGGSLGSAVFTALLADQRKHQPALTRCDRDSFTKLNGVARDILAEDFLSPALAGLLYPDLVQRILPAPFESFDRARAIETAWEAAWLKHTRSKRFAEPLDKLWEIPEPRWLPALLLNATWVETGKRLITSNLRVRPTRAEQAQIDKSARFAEFADVEDTHYFYTPRALPLSAAVHLSARFTYVSPAGTLEKDGTTHGHSVDGGYFENSGTTAVLEILKVINQLKEPNSDWARVQPYVILIGNEPVDTGNLDRSLHKAPDNPSIEPLRFAPEIRSPFKTLFATREARGEHARVSTRWHVGNSQFLHFGLCEDEKTRIPLGWVLSGAVRERMDTQLSGSACGPFNNKANIESIDRVLRERMRQR
jgi:hypothetical protein